MRRVSVNRQNPRSRRSSPCIVLHPFASLFEISAMHHPSFCRSRTAPTGLVVPANELRPNAAYFRKNVALTIDARRHCATNFTSLSFPGVMTVRVFPRDPAKFSSATNPHFPLCLRPSLPTVLPPSPAARSCAIAVAPASGVQMATSRGNEMGWLRRQLPCCGDLFHGRECIKLEPAISTLTIGRLTVLMSCQIKIRFAMWRRQVLLAT